MVTEKSTVEDKYKALREYREKLAAQGLHTHRTYEYKMSQEVRDKRWNSADTATKIGERLLMG